MQKLKVRICTNILFLQVILLAALFRNITLGADDKFIYIYAVGGIIALGITIMDIIVSMSRYDYLYVSIMYVAIIWSISYCSDNKIRIPLTIIFDMMLIGYIIFKYIKMSKWIEPAKEYDNMKIRFKLLHFVIVFEMLFIALDATTKYSIFLALFSIIYVAFFRGYVYNGYISVKSLVTGTFLEVAAAACMLWLMPYHTDIQIVAVQIQSNMTTYIRAVFMAILLATLEIPFNPIWMEERKIK